MWPPEPVVEFHCNPNALRDDLLIETIRLVDRRVPVPQRAGPGIDIDEAVLIEYCQSRGRSTADPS